MEVVDDILVKNPFGFQLAGVLVNDAVTREAITKDQMRKFLKFVHDDVVYCKYYEVVYILFHTGMRTSDMRYIIETTKMDAGTRVLSITEEGAQMFQAIIEARNASKVEKSIDDIVESCFTMIMECRLWQCTGSIVSTIWSADTMTSTGCRCQTSRLIYADTPIVRIWQNRE